MYSDVGGLLRSASRHRAVQKFSEMSCFFRYVEHPVGAEMMRPVLRVLRRGGHAEPICQRCRMTLLQNICFRNLEFLTRRRRTERICDRLALWRRSPGDRAGLLCTVQLTRPSSQAIGKAGAAGPPRTSTARRSRRPSAASVPEIHI